MDLAKELLKLEEMDKRGEVIDLEQVDPWVYKFHQWQKSEYVDNEL